MGASGVIGVRFLPKRVRKPMLSYRCPLAGGGLGQSSDGGVSCWRKDEP